MSDAKTAPADRLFTAAWRAWVQDSLAVLGASALSVGRDLGLGKNTLGDFLRDPARDIRLETAHGITCHLRERAAASGKVLPAFDFRFGAARPAQAGGGANG